MSHLERAFAAALGRTRYEDYLDVRLGGYDESRREALFEEHITFIGDVDLSEASYSFDLLRFYVRKRDGMVLYGTDSGCSCPSPFEDITLGELKETSVDRVADLAREMADQGSNPTSQVVAEATALIPAMRKAGAR